MTISEFCEKHRACDDGREWALANCSTMQEAWETAQHKWLIWIATRRGVVADNQLRKFAVWSARQVQHLMTDQRSIEALNIAERFAEGDATDSELAVALDAARAAAWSEAWASAGAAAGDAAWYAARYAAGYAAGAAARAAAWAEGDASGDASGDAQDKWLRTNIVPNFEL